MNVHDWPLIIFTILAQMSVGAFVMLGLIHLYATNKTNETEADKLSDRALLAIGPVLVLGFIASLFHLGDPLNAPRAITHFGSSWLSREISFGVVFAVLGAVFAFMQWRKITTPAIRNLVAIAAAVVGLAMVFSMSMVYYTLETVPAWNTLATPVLFFVTTFLLGALAMGAAFVANYSYLRSQGNSVEVQMGLLKDVLRWIALVSVVLLGIEFIVMPLYLADLSTNGAPAATSSLEYIMTDNSLILGLRLVLVFLGAGLAALFIYQNANTGKNVQVMGVLVYLAFALVLIAEVVGRYLFYGSYFNIGL